MTHFDQQYWQNTSKQRPLTCQNCGHKVKKHSASSTGYTHYGSWQGIRCQNLLVGATPVSR